MGYTTVLETVAARHEGSTPSKSTNIHIVYWLGSSAFTTRNGDRNPVWVPIMEAWQSGLMYSFAKAASVKAPWVQIPPFPPPG